MHHAFDQLVHAFEHCEVAIYDSAAVTKPAMAHHLCNDCEIVLNVADFCGPVYLSQGAPVNVRSIRMEAHMDVKLNIAQILNAVVIVPPDERDESWDSVLHMSACIAASQCRKSKSPLHLLLQVMSHMPQPAKSSSLQECKTDLVLSSVRGTTSSSTGAHAILLAILLVSALVQIL